MKQNIKTGFPIKNLYILGFLVSIFFCSCVKETIREVRNITDVVDTTGRKDSSGIIVGAVSTSTPGGTVVFPLKSVNISIEGFPQKTISDSNGFFTLKNVPTGNFTIYIHKDSFGYVKEFNCYFPGHGTLNLGMINLNKLPNYEFYGLTDSVNINIRGIDSLYIMNGYFKIKTPELKNSMGAFFAFGFTENFDINDLIKPYSTMYSISSGSKIGNFSIPISGLVDFMYRHFMLIHGITIYLKIYPVTYRFTNYFDYTDPIKGGQFTSLGTPISGQFVLP